MICNNIRKEYERIILNFRLFFDYTYNKTCSDRVPTDFTVNNVFWNGSFAHRIRNLRHMAIDYAYEHFAPDLRDSQFWQGPP